MQAIDIMQAKVQKDKKVEKAMEKFNPNVKKDFLAKKEEINKIYQEGIRHINKL